MSGIGGPSRALVAETLPFWRSDAQPFLLYSLFWDPPGQTASTIAARFGLSREPVPKEARRLLNAEIIEWRSVGRNKVLALVEQHPATKADDAQVTLQSCSAECPQWSALPTEYVRTSGTDNAMWRLRVEHGEDLVVRLPRRPYAAEGLRSNCRSARRSGGFEDSSVALLSGLG